MRSSHLLQEVERCCHSALETHHALFEADRRCIIADAVSVVPGGHRGSVAVSVAELKPNLFHGRVDVCGGNVMLFGERRGQQQAVTEGVDPPRNSRGEGVNRVECPGLEPGIFAPTHVP